MGEGANEGKVHQDGDTAAGDVHRGGDAAAETMDGDPAISMDRDAADGDPAISMETSPDALGDSGSETEASNTAESF